MYVCMYICMYVCMYVCNVCMLWYGMDLCIYIPFLSVLFGLFLPVVGPVLYFVESLSVIVHSSQLSM